MSAQPPIRTLLVATDFSPQSTRAMARAARLAGEHGARLELVHAAPMPMPMPVWGDMAGGAWIENSELVAAGEAHLQRDRETLLASHDISIELHCAAGSAVQLVLARAEAIDADLIVLGATGEGALAQRLFGSTAQSIVRHASRPLLVVRGESVAAYASLLVATDFTDHADAAAQRARQLAPAARVAVLHALEQSRLRIDWLPGIDEAARAANLQRARELADQRLQHLAERLGDPDGRRYVRDGRASHELPAVLDDVDADLLSVGAHGKSRLEAGLLGSTSLHAVAEADCDVLVVPPLH